MLRATGPCSRTLRSTALALVLRRALSAARRPWTGRVATGDGVSWDIGIFLKSGSDTAPSQPAGRMRSARLTWRDSRTRPDAAERHGIARRGPRLGQP
ncbi:hypothetical protein SCOCK_140101 [Actinacidiphila cocklensis]|uniref:Uncharacterized protein n=1 Tax=Actinacidiphila cocklensis TaxID=887465 RepID=A0A9W4GP12_9ACTN|nr:hypothetical protein SCOCK_140101 [Actinacidiphila cocklensis]